MAELNTMNIFIGAFIAILIGVVFVQVVANNIEANRELSNTVNESITITGHTGTITNESITLSSGLGTTVESPVTSVTFFGNATNGTQTSGIEVGDEVNYTVNGNILVSTDRLPGSGPYNISYVILANTTGATINENLHSVSFFGNATVSTHITDIDVDTEVNWTKNGSITVTPYNFSAGPYNISYSYEGDLYVTNSISRTLLGLVTIFFVLGIVAIGIFMIRKSYPDLF